MIRITRISLQKHKIYTDTEKEMNFCRKCMSVEIDGAEYSKLFEEGRWDGTHKFVDKNGIIGSGLIYKLKEKLEEREFEFKIIDNFIKDKKISFDIDKRMRYYQADSITEFFKHNIGTIKVPPRGGKTFIGSEMARIFLNKFDKGSFVFFVDTEDLFKQALDDISTYLNVDMSEIGMINSKKKIFKRINVAMIQTVVSTMSKRTKDIKKQRSMMNFLRSVKFCAVDEVHENSSDKRLAIYRKCKNTEFLVSFSGTPKKQFGEIENMKMEEFFGGIIFEIPKSELQEEGFLSLDKVFLIHVNHNKKRFRCDNYREFLTKYIHTNEYRNSLLEQTIEICIKNKWKTLVLFNSKEHGRLISKNLLIPFISGDDDGKIRTLQKNKFLKGRGKVLLASNIFKKGITLPEAEVLIIGDGGLEGTNITQKYSRVLGVTETKNKAVIIDFMDSGVNYFNEHSLNRLEVYVEEMGNDRIEVYDDYQLSSMEESIEEWLNLEKSNG